MTFWSATWFGELLYFSLLLVYFTTICFIIFAVLKLEMSASVLCTTCVLWNNCLYFTYMYFFPNNWSLNDQVYLYVFYLYVLFYRLVIKFVFLLVLKFLCFCCWSWCRSFCVYSIEVVCFSIQNLSTTLSLPFPWWEILDNYRGFL
jgi:hypothetical protein